MQFALLGVLTLLTGDLSIMFPLANDRIRGCCAVLYHLDLRFSLGLAREIQLGEHTFDDVTSDVFLIHYTLVVTSGLLQCTTLELPSPSIRRFEMPSRVFGGHSIVLIGISSHPFSASILHPLSLTENGSAQCKGLYTVSSP
jgi:hypothetical protein